jgi:hypothetical protein
VFFVALAVTVLLSLVAGGGLLRGS